MNAALREERVQRAAEHFSRSLIITVEIVVRICCQNTLDPGWCSNSFCFRRINRKS